LLKELVIAIQSYLQAHEFIRKYKLWKWILIPGFIYMVLFSIAMYVFWHSSNSAVSWFSQLIGVSRWLHMQHSEVLSFLFLMGELMVRLTMLFFYFSLFKYLILIIGSPLFAYLSEKTESIMEGKEFEFAFATLGQDISRGIRLAFRNCFWQTVYTITILILSFIPAAGWITPVMSSGIECYYWGFSMIDYSNARHKMSPAGSIAFVQQRRGLALGNGLIFFLMHFIPFAGWVLAPTYAIVAATLSVSKQSEIA
jgi:CysZ protein